MDNLSSSPASPGGSLSPRAELAEFISSQETRIGDVYNLSEEGLDARGIADRLNVDTPGFVYQYQAQIAAALDGRAPSGPSMLKSVASALNGLVKRSKGVLSPEALELLTSNRARIALAIEELDPAEEAQAEAEDEQREEGQLDELAGVTGIYAFSYGWYLDNPLSDENDRTLIKVGRARDVAARIRQHRAGARTHIPEPLVTVRVFGTGDRDVEKVERSFQRLLKSAGHTNPRRDTSGRNRKNEVGEEWYLTNREFLDAVAAALELRTIYAA
ncbi:MULTISPECIES: GIY-YIG nuclease family protein [unclassified Dietzia]|uniref:GIY-YIG nuclease family protein n=1 Tax=unclassified Dietzia TaxID=2617939 RepID=UPI0015F7AC65|nr:MULTISPECIES: GIY-YIG nuclease family protein [unclassified Dietzia]MBB1026073.1 GIY-YIG nuclease family protein [Dietzia sp. DQ12-76]MBB1029055.1 GIY-YIG nuclease family protein [Dietzia sp. DQ11-38-2]